MVGDFMERVLVLLLGYAYPGFECFKALESGDLQMHQLRFWCQYWVIVAFLTVAESFTDALFSWLPVYSEVKLALFIYLWYPQTRGSSLIYEKILQPYVAKYEPDFEEKLKVLRAKTADLLLFYIKNFTSKGQSMVLEILQYVMTSQTPRLTGTEEQQRKSKSSKDTKPVLPPDYSAVEAFLVAEAASAPPEPQVSDKKGWGPTRRKHS